MKEKIEGKKVKLERKQIQIDTNKAHKQNMRKT